jgi:peroxiredoxin
MSGGRKPSAPSRANELAEIVLPDHDSHEVRLGALWSEGPAVLVWLRHYGCIYCRALAMQLHGARSDFPQAGARLVLIGQGKPRDAAQFRRRQGIQVTVLADAERVSYRAVGAKVAGFADLWGPKVVAKGALTGAKHRVLQGRTVGDSAQLGGAILVLPDGQVAWSHLSTDAADDASPEEILAAVRTAGA